MISITRLYPALEESSGVELCKMTVPLINPTSKKTNRASKLWSVQEASKVLDPETLSPYVV